MTFLEFSFILLKARYFASIIPLDPILQLYIYFIYTCSGTEYLAWATIQFMFVATV